MGSQKKKKTKVKREFSAGGVVFRKRKNGRIEWLIGKSSSYYKWVFPKGIIEKGEGAEKTALREVEEEAGVRAKIVAKIVSPERYVYQFEGTMIFKNVVYFLMQYLSGKTEHHDFEMEEVSWLPYEKAMEKLEFKGAKEVLAKAKKILEEKGKQPKLF